MKTTKNKFKNCLICVFSAAILTLSGCSGDNTQSSGGSTQSSGDNTQYKNLDIENTKVIENVPKSGKWYTLKFDYKHLTKNSYNVLRDGAKAIGIAEPEKEKVLCSVSYSDDEPNVDIVYPEMKDEDYARTYYMRYVTDDIFIAYNLSNRFEFYNRKALREIRNEEYDRLWEWKPGFTGEAHIKNYDLSENADISDSYTLNGKQTSISDALKYAEETLNSGKMTPMASKLYTYTPVYVNAYQFSNNKNAYAYDFGFQLNYDNIPIDASESADAPSLDLNDLFSNKIRLCMFTPSSIDWLWSSPIGFETPTAQEECELTIDFDDACRIVSEKLSQEEVFKIAKAELIYSARAVYNDSEQSPSTEYIIEPSWQFYFGSGTQEYGGLCANVNAVNGTLNLRQLV